MEPVFFATPAEFRAWLEANHETADEMLVGFHRKGSGQPSMTWQESIDQALGYRRLAIHWVTSAKRPETRERRLTQLIDDSAAGRVNCPPRRYRMHLGPSAAPE